jgi:hypothetical protein
MILNANKLKYFNYIFVISFIIICCNSCISYKSLSIQDTSYHGNFKKISDNSILVKFRVDIDSLKNIRFRLYSEGGIKLTDMTLNSETIKISYIIDNLYKDEILKMFYNMNKGTCLSQVLIDFLNGKLFNALQKSICYNISNHSDGNFVVSSMDYHELFEIESPKFYHWKDSNIIKNCTIHINHDNYLLFLEK